MRTLMRVGDCLPFYGRQIDWQFHHDDTTHIINYLCRYRTICGSKRANLERIALAVASEALSVTYPTRRPRLALGPGRELDELDRPHIIHLEFRREHPRHVAVGRARHAPVSLVHQDDVGVERLERLQPPQSAGPALDVGHDDAKPPLVVRRRPRGRKGV